MTRFTDSPYEYLMTQKPHVGKKEDAGPAPCPPGSRCAGCPYGKERSCIGVCIKKLILSTKKRREGEREHGKDV